MSEQVIAVVIALGAISEALSFIPAVKSNGVFQLAYSILKAVKDKIKPNAK